jgi:ribose transport system substrate-binding protein
MGKGRVKEEGAVRKLIIPAVCAFVACLALVIAGCGSSDSSTSGGGSSGESKDSAVVAEAQKSLAELESKVLSKGPLGESPAPASSVKLSPQELQKVKGMNATAAIVLHYGGNDWSTAQVDGLEATFDELGIETIAVTDANFKPDKQVTDIETVLQKNPDIIVSIPTDPVATAGAYRKAASQGVKLVFMDNIPEGFEPGKDYISDVSADNYGNGIASADLMAEDLEGEGKIGIIYHEADFFVTKQRYEAFKTTIEEKYPDIEIVAEQGVAGPDFAGESEKVASAMLTRNPDLNGIWAVWDVPAEGVLAAARANARDDLVVTTMDLGANVAIDMAQGGPVKGLAAQRPYDQGAAEATLAAYGLLGKKAPPYVALNALPVTPENLESAWEQVYHAPLPAEVSEAGE